MKKIIIGLILLIFNLPFIAAQNDTTESLQPILVNKSVLSGVGLEKIDLKDEPEKDFYQKRLYRGEDISVYVVSTETWNNKITSYPFDEYVYLINGQAIVKPKVENSKVFDAHNHLFVPKGFEGEWEIRAGNNLHYELSVITTRRADSTKYSTDLHYKDLNGSRLSGCQVSFKDTNSYTELLQKGVELTITLEAEKPMEKIVTVPMKEKLVHLLSGQLTITVAKNEDYTFYTGDFFILPKGLKGKWKSEGHGMIKYMTVEKSK